MFRSLFWFVGSLAMVFGAVAVGLVQARHVALPVAAGVYGCFVGLLALAIAPGMPKLRPAIESLLRARRGPVILITFWCLPYLVYAAGTRDFRWLAFGRLLAIAAPVLIIYELFPVLDVRKFAWQDLAIGLWLAGFLMSVGMKGIWSVPQNLDFMARLFLVCVGAWCWVFVRRVPEVAYELSLTPNVLTAAARNFAMFAVIALPAGLAMRFTAWNPRWRGGGTFCLDFLEIFLFIALLEELFFRGFLQTLISQSLRSPLKGQILVSFLFGLFHILHAPFPNWRYVILASVAGWFYGSAFRSANLTASALTHAMVDTVWRTFLSKS